jgi:hypothetical protein
VTQPNSITGVIPPYAGGSAKVGTAMAPIDQQGNFSVPVRPSPATQTIVLTPPLGAPYLPLSLSVVLAPGAKNITAQIAGALTVVGAHIGIPGSLLLGTDVSGNAVPGTGDGSGTVTSVTFTGNGIVDSSTPSSAVTGSGTALATALVQTANLLLAGPTTGSAAKPTFRALVDADFPNTLAPVVSGANLTSLPGAAIVSGLAVPGTIYSVAGTPLPTPSSGLKGARAVVSDATTPVWMVAYAGSGAVTCPVFCDGTTWFTA